MSKQQYFIIFLNFCVVCSSKQTSDLFPDDLKLVKTIVMFRHGMRAPAKLFKIDSFAESDDKNLWPEGVGGLVNEGKIQMYQLGKRLRQRYEHLLVPYGNTVAEDVQMVTTAVDRCYQSGALVLTGFYPPNPDQVWNKDLSWQPIPIHSPSPDKVHVFGQKVKCPHFYEEWEEVWSMVWRNDSDSTKMNYDYLMHFLSNFTFWDEVHVHEMSLKNVDNLVLFAEYVEIKKLFNLKLPYWVDNDLLDRLQKFHVDALSFLIYNPRMREIIIGSLIRDVIYRIQDVMNNSSVNSKFYFYAGHDISLMALFDDFNMKRNFIPTHGASFIFEIYRSQDGNFFIKSLFNKDHSLEHLEVKILPNCEVYCSANKFFHIFDKYITLDWKKICDL